MSRASLTTCIQVPLMGSVLALSVLAQDRTQLPAVVAVTLFASGFLVALWARGSVTLREVLLFAVVFRLALVWLPPSLSDDAFRYVWDGALQAEQINPYRYTPEDAALASLQVDVDDVYERLNSKSFYSVYPPVSQYVFAFGGLFTGHGWKSSHYAIKGVLVLAEIMALFLLARLVSARNLMLYAWNPLVLLETAGQGHTESLLLLLLIIVIRAGRSGKGTWASVALAAAAWVKLFPVLLFPFLWRRFGWRAVWTGILALLLLAVPYAAPYVIGHVQDSLDLYTRYFEFNAGLYYAIKQVFYWLTGADYSKQIGPALRWCLLLGLPFLYVLDYRYRWPLHKAFLAAIGLYLTLSTTVHPWYLLSVLFLAALLERPVWAWFWVGAMSVGTYLLYAGGPYWVFVMLVWSGGFVIACVQYGPALLQAILRQRARTKARFISTYLPRRMRPLTILDLGCGEGYVGEHIREIHQAEVVLTDIVNLNRTALPHTLCGPRTLPWSDDTFDVVVLYFVLHHAEDASAVLSEACRVARQRVLVVESVYEARLELMILEMLDKAVNRLRHWRHMKQQEVHLAFKTAARWRRAFAVARIPVIAEATRGSIIHRQQLFVLDARRWARVPDAPEAD